MLFKEKKRVVALIFFFLSCSLPLSAHAEGVHEVELDLGYVHAFNWIQIHNSTGNYTLPDSANQTNLSANEEYKIKCNIKNTGDFNETVNLSLIILDSNNDTVHSESIPENLSTGQGKWPSFDWDTSSLPEGLYSITFNLSVVLNGTSANDSNISNNFRSRTVRITVYHDVEIALDYNGSFNGIRIVDYETDTALLNNSGNLTILPLGEVFNISYKVRNKGNINEIIYTHLDIFNSSEKIDTYSWAITGETAGQTIVPPPQIWHTYNANLSKILNATELVNLTEGFYTLAVNATINGVNDSNTIDNYRARRVYLNNPPVIDVHSPESDIICAGNVPLNFSVSDTKSNISAVWYVLDNEKKIVWDDRDSPTLNYNGTITNLTGGTHTINVFANDTFGYLGYSNTVSFMVLGTVNAKEFIHELRDQHHILNASLRDADNNSIDYSDNESLPVNKSFTLSMEINASGVNVGTVIPRFNGLKLNWNNTLNLIVDASSNISHNVRDASGINITHLILFINTSDMLPDDDYLEGAILSIKENHSQRTHVYYIEDESGEIIHSLGECSSVDGPMMPVTTTNMCYINYSYNNSGITKIWVPHLSGVALGEDNMAPEIDIIEPQDNSIGADSFLTLNFTVRERNPKQNNFCRYEISGEDPVNLDKSEITWDGVNGTYTTSITGMLNGAYSLIINCTDINGQSTRIHSIFSVNDITPPEITDTDRRYSEKSSGVTVKIEAETNEPATCRYDTRDKSYPSLSEKMSASSSKTEHRAREEYSSDKSGKYYIKCIDRNGNAMDDPETISFSVDVKETNSGGDDDDEESGNLGVGKMSCYDGIGGCHHGSCEKGVDCGGPCQPCSSCFDGTQNQGEEGVDCGGPCEACEIPTTTSTTTTTTTTTKDTTTTTTEDTTTATTLKRVYYTPKKKNTSNLAGMVTGVDLFGVVTSLLILVILILSTAISVFLYKSKRERKIKKDSGGGRAYTMETTRRGTRLGDV